jgi:RimJ/RimL family protein N-acetyltransferase
MALPSTVMDEVVAETERVVLRRWTEADVDPLVRLGKAEVVRFLGGQPWTPTSVRESMEIWAQIEDRLGITTWVVEMRRGEVIGTCGFAGTNVPWLRVEFVIEIGWTLSQTWWGRGLATEAAQAALGVGLDHYPAKRFISKCNIHNAASERVMHRIGMRRVGVVQGAWQDPIVICRLP